MHMIKFYESASAEQNRTYRWPSATAVALLRPAAARPRALASATAALALGLGVLVQLLHAQGARTYVARSRRGARAARASSPVSAGAACRRLRLPGGRAGPAPL